VASTVPVAGETVLNNCTGTCGDWQVSANTSDAAYAGSGFARRYHYVAENPTGYRKVRVYLRWKNAAGSNIGTASAEYDWYQRMWNGQSQADMEYCIQDW
jgi:hypothetical protein